MGRAVPRVAALLDRAPTVSTPAVMATTAGAAYVVADVFTTAAMVSQWDEVPHPYAALFFTGLTVVLGLVIVRRGARWRRGTYHLLLVGATLLVSVSILSSPGGATAVALASLYALVAIIASFFFSLRLSLRHLALALGMCAVSCAVSGGVGLAEYLLVVGEAVVSSGVVAWLTMAAADSETDALTGLPNRRGLDRVLDQQLSRISQGSGLVLGVLDLDFFKLVNDVAGHAEGDRLLREVAQTWRQLLPDRHILARMGGDEFALLLCDVDRAEADVLAERLRLSLGERSVTLGLATWEHGDSAGMLLGRADAALYAGKRSGRNRVAWHESGTAALSEPLHEAVLAGRLQMHFQPIVDLTDGSVVGAEALARWPDGTGGWHAPATFIPVAERTGIIHELGAWALSSACEAAGAWAADGMVLEKLSVNVSPVQLQSPDFPGVVRAVLAQTGYDPSRLVLEVTESAIGAEGALACRTLADLRDLGIRVAIDDFGTGYSTFARLRDVPVDILKVDRSFVSTLGGEESHSPIVGAVIAVARSLGLATVAEGVETPEQAAMLHRLGCGEAQGYLYSPAVPADRLVALWRASGARDRRAVPTP
jgi:diguanylate cyclase (GGDEF)-like protein